MVERQLTIYRNVNGMSGGSNPRSHRLDGLSSKKAKARLKRGQMSQKDYFLNMSENGLRTAAGENFVEGDREATIRKHLESIRND